MVLHSGDGTFILDILPHNPEERAHIAVGGIDLLHLPGWSRRAADMPVKIDEIDKVR
jgi:hypothetical protein